MEKEIIKEAIAKFEECTGFSAKYKENKLHTVEGDGLLCLGVDENEYCFNIEVKRTINKTIIGQTAQQILKNRNEVILITRYVSPQLADNLKDLKIPFLDTAGNAYINCKPLFIFAKGNKLSELDRPEAQNRAFKLKGLQVTFALLCNKGLEHRSLREIAELTNVALGTVQWVMKDLKKLGYLIERKKSGRKLINKEEILRRWIVAYSEQLRPKQLNNRFKAMKKDWWIDVEIDQYEALWGSEVAAAKLTQKLKPETITIYMSEPPGALVLMGRLKKDPQGNVEILNKFWNADLNDLRKDLVHPILIYADLIASGDERNIEIANIIYEKEIVRFIREN